MKKVFKSKRWIAFFMALLLVVMTCIGSSDAFLRATDGGETAVSEEEGSGPAEETQYVEVEEATGENDSEDGINSEETEAENADHESNVADEEGKVQEPGESEETENPEETDKTDMTEENADQETTEELPEEIPAVIEEEVKYGWTVSYYYDGTEDKDARVEGEGLLGEQIFDAGSAEEETVHSGKNYVLDRIENKGGEITEDAGKNVVKVYYVLKKEEAAKPAQTLKARAEDGARVTVDAPEGALPEGSKVTISVVKDSEVLKKFREAAEVDGKVLTDIKLYDVTIRDAEGREIQPNDSVTVTITNTGLEGDDASVFHADDEKAPVKKVADIDDANNASFEAEHFSVNAIAVYAAGDIKEYNIEAVLDTEIQLFNLREEGIYDIYSGDFSWEITEGKEIVKKSDYFSEDNLGIYVLHGIAVGKATVKVSKGSEDIAIFHITVKSSDLSNPVYVYVKLDGMQGNNGELSEETLKKLEALGLSVNGHGWCTVGMIDDVPIETPEQGEAGTKKESYGRMVTEEAKAAVLDAIQSGNLSRFGTHKVVLDKVLWFPNRSDDDFGLLVSNGSDDYVEEGSNVWHLNGYLDVRKISYTIKYVDKESKEEIADEVTREAEWAEIGNEIHISGADIKTIPGYTYAESFPSGEKLKLGLDGNVITLYYERPALKTKIYKTASAEKAEAGQTVHYSIEVENTSSERDLSNVVILDKMTNASGEIKNVKGAAYEFDKETNTYKFTIEKIPPAISGQQVHRVTITYDYIVPDADMGKTIINTVELSNSEIELEDDSKLTAEVEIKKGVLTVKAGNPKSIYDGTDQTIENVFADEEVQISNTGLKGIPVKVGNKDYYVTGVTAKAEGKDAGTYSNVITVADAKVYDEAGEDVTGRFTVNGESGTFTINKRDVTLVSAYLEKEYDGTVLKNESAGEEGVKLFNIADGKKEDVTSLLDSGLLKEKGWVDGEGVDVTFTKSVRHPNEQSSNEFTYKAKTGTDTNLENYNIKVVFGMLAITNRLARYEITLVTNSGNELYDGKEHEVTGFKQVLGKNTTVKNDGANTTIEFKIGGQDYVISGLTASGKGITVTDYPEGYGGYPVRVNGTPVVTEKETGKKVSDQFNITYKEGLLKINERLITITAGSASYKYTGEEYKASEMEKPTDVTKGTLVEGQNYGAEVSGSQQLVGECATAVVENSVKISDKNGNDVTGNYKITYKPGVIKVTDGGNGDDVDDELVIKKNADKTEGYEVGEIVEFTISVKNIFDKDMTVTLEELQGVEFDEIKDDGKGLTKFGSSWKNLISSIFGSGNEKTFTIKAGETKDVTVFYRITQDDILEGKFINKATVTLNDKRYDAEKEVTTEKPNGHITVTKDVASIQTADGYPTEKPDLGDIIEYIVEVKNDGNLIMEDVVVEDKLEGVVFKDLDGGEDIGDGKVKFETLGINGHKKITAIYTVKEEDIARGSVTNAATATGKGPNDENPPKVDDKDAEVTTPTEEPKGYIKLIKEVIDEKAEYAVGAVVEYEIKAFNDGNVSVKDLVVEDVLTGNTKDNNPLGYSGEIAPGQTVSLGKVSYTVKETDVRNTQSKLNNIVTGEGSTGIKNPDTGDDVPVTVIPGEKDIVIEKDRPSLSITKTADKISDVQLGDEITYTITVTNNGNVTINNIVAEDELLGKTGENALIYEGTLTPGESKTFTETYVVSEKDVLAGRVKNTATVKGENSVPGGVDPEDEATVITPVKDIDVSYEVRKILLNPKEEYRVGDTVSYEIRVKNHGNVTLENVELRDALSDATGNKVTFTEINGVAPEDIDPMAPGTRVTINSDNTVTVAAIAPKEEVALRCEYIVVRADAGNSIRNKVYVKADPVKPTEVDGGPADPDKEWIYPKDKDAEADPAKVEDIYNLIIHYVYANGATAAADYAGQYLKGEMYGPIYSPNIAGYTSSTAFISSSEKGMPAEDVVLTVVYLTQTTPGGGGGGGDDTPDTPPTPPTPPVNPDPTIPIQPEPVPAGGTGTPVVTTGGPALAALDDEAIPLGALIDVDEDGNVTITPINEEQIPLAGGRNDDHKCCILHFLLMLAALIIYTWYTHSMKKHQKKLAELKDQLAEETLKKQLGITDDRQAKM